jgi:hypothetical protein
MWGWYVRIRLGKKSHYFSKVNCCNLLLYLCARAENIFILLYQDSAVEIGENIGRYYQLINNRLESEIN